MFNKKQLIIKILKNLLKAGVAVAVAAVVVFFAGKQISEISQTIREQRISAFVLEKRNETIFQLREGFKVIGDANTKIEESLPLAENILGFVVSLENLANQNSVQQILNFSAPIGKSIDYNINLNANISSLINYLKNFEKLPYFTGISSFNLSAPSVGGWEGDSAIFLKAKVFIR